MSTLSFDVAWRDRGATAGLRGLAAQTKATRQGFEDMRAATVRAAGALKKAQQDSIDATRAVAIQEARLKEARESGKAKASQILAIEDRLASARRRVTDASDNAKQAINELRQAQEREQAASRKSAAAAELVAGGFRKIRSAAASADRAVGAGFSSVGRGLGKIGGAAALMGAGTVAAFGTAAVAAVGFGVKVASGNEQARISFTTMLGSAQKADVFLRKLQKFAAATPFEFPELQTAASSLISAGINANKVIPIMTTLGNVTSGMGTGAEGVKRATIALQQMNAAGRITGEDLNQLRDAGIPVYGLLAAATGKSQAEVLKLAQAGKLGKKELGQMMQALESGKGLERFSGLMEKQSHSLAGLWSTFKDTFGQGMAGVMSQFFPMMKSGLEDVSTGASKVFGWFKRNRDSIGSVFATAADSLKAFGRIAKPVLGAFVTALSGGKGSFKDFAEFLSTHQADIVGGFVSFGKGAIGFGIVLAKVISGGLRGFGVFADGINQLTMTFIDSAGVMLHAVASAFRWDPVMGPQMRAAEDKFKQFSDHARGNMGKTGDAARGMADKIDNSLIPALGDAGKALDAVGRKEIVKAEARDNAKKAALAIEEIGNKGDFSRLKLKGFNWESDKGTKGQRALKGRLDEARTALMEQYNSAKTLGAGHKTLNGILKTGRDRLRDEFIQMGYTKKQADRLADSITKIPKKHDTQYNDPGAKEARAHAKDLRNQLKHLSGTRRARIQFESNIADIAGKYGITIAHGRGRSTKGGLQKEAAGGLIRGPGSGTSDSILGMELGGTPTAWVSNGEYVVNARQTRKNLDVLEAINGGQDLPRRATGGVVINHGQFNGSSGARVYDALGDRLAANLGDRIGSKLGKWLAGAAGTGGFGGAGVAGAGHLAAAALAQVGSTAWGIGQCLKFVRTMAGAPGGTYDASAAWRNARYKHPGDHNVPSSVPVYWSGGHGHIAASIGGGRIVTTDFPRTGRIGVTTIGRLTSAWGKHYSGWANDVNGRVTSRYGLSSGGVVGVGVGEHGPERVLSAAQTRTFDRMVRVMDSRGAGNTYMVNISAPNYVGSRQELRKTLVDMARSGAFEVVKR